MMTTNQLAREQEDAVTTKDREVTLTHSAAQRSIPLTLKEKHKELIATYKRDMAALAKSRAPRKERGARERKLKEDRKAADVQAREDLKASRRTLGDWRRERPKLEKAQRAEREGAAAAKKKAVDEEHAPRLAELRAEDKGAEDRQACVDHHSSLFFSFFFETTCSSSPFCCCCCCCCSQALFILNDPNFSSW